MDTLRDDPELAAEMVGLMGRELKSTRKKAEALEQEVNDERKRATALEASHQAEQARAEAAEHARDIFELNMGKFAKESKRLLEELEQVRAASAGKRIKKEKKEEVDFVLGSLGDRDRGLDVQRAAELTTLEGSLAEIRSKYDLQLAKNKELRKTCESSVARITTLEAEKADLNNKLGALRVASQQKIQELETQIQRMKMTLVSQATVPTSTPALTPTTSATNQVPELGPQRDPKLKTEPISATRLEQPDFQKFLSGLSIPPTHPQFHRLYPIQNTHINLNHYLPPLLSAARCLIRFMHFPDRLTWPKTTSCALAFGPFMVRTIGAHPEVWERSREASSMHGHVGELFYSNEASVYYAGTFRCIWTAGWFLEGVDLPGDISAEAIAEIALNRDSTCSAAYKAMIARSFADGVMKAECMVLECVGFNHGLYNILLDQYTPDVGSKHVGEQDGAGNSKRRRGG